MSFTHLHVHSEYSLVDGLARIPDLLDAAAQAGFTALALTDLHNVFAAIKFYDYAMRKGLKPIIGCELNLETPGSDENCNIVLLCMNRTGYHNLLALLTRSYRQMKGEKPAICYEWLAEYCDGLIALSGGCRGDVGRALLSNHISQACHLAQIWRRHFPDRYYIEVSRTGRETDSIHNERAVAFAVRESLPLVATNDVRFLREQQFNAHEARVCIAAGSILNDPSRKTRYSVAQYLKNADEMSTLFHDLPAAFSNAAEIVKRCNVIIETSKILLPQFPLAPEQTADAELTRQATAGLETVLAAASGIVADRQAYQQRLHEELKIIHLVGYASYFLIVADIVSWARQNNIAVGPGRGSGASSLVAYALGITAIDPLQHELLFERFLNPERISMPDFDIDLCVEGREQVIAYIAERYGHDKVSQIITFGSMAARAVVRDVGRVTGKPYGYVDTLAKLIPRDLHITLDEALKKSPDLKECYENDSDVKQIIDISKELEGLPRNPGTHAGGVVIAPDTLTKYTALYLDAKEKTVLTHFDMNDLEKIGLVKFDFLGLKTLTVIDKTLRRINQPSAAGAVIGLTAQDIPLDDPETFRLLSSGDTTAVFQLESEGIRHLIKKLCPDKFEDIVALIALYRPGPLQSGMVDDYIKCKHGANVKYPDAKIESVLKPTYGVIVYQEQVMQIARELAGYTLGSADLLRRAMGKKLLREMAQQRQTFVTGACDRGVHRDVAIHIFDLIEKFAGYGFNRSHSVAYALLAYQTAWLKSHHPAAFMSAVLSSEMRNTEKIVDLIYASRAMHLKILPPNVNHSDWEFRADNAEEIRYGLGAVRHLGEKLVQGLVQERSIAQFTSAEDFCRRMIPKQMRQNIFTILIGVGALDSFGTRTSLLADAAKIYALAANFLKDQQSGQSILFKTATSDAAGSRMAMSEQECDNTDHTRLLSLELENLGVYFSTHPLHRYRDEISRIVRMNGCVDDAATANGRSDRRYRSTCFAGVITRITHHRSRRSKGIRFQLDDGEKRQELLLYNKAFIQYAKSLEKGKIIIAQAKSFYDSGEIRRWRAQTIYSLDEFRATAAQLVVLAMDLEQLSPDFTRQMSVRLKPFVSAHGCVVKCSVRTAEISADLILNQEWKVRVCEKLLTALQAIKGVRNVRILY